MHYQLLYSIEGIDPVAFLKIFEESTLKNAPVWYPDLSPGDAIERYEAGFWNYMHSAFWAEHGILALLTEGNRYVSSLRLYQKAPHSFLMEALETKPDCRNRGYGTEIIRRTMDALEESYGKIQLLSFTGKHNTASQKTHTAAGMTLIRDDWQMDDGSIDTTQVTFSYQTIGYSEK